MSTTSIRKMVRTVAFAIGAALLAAVATRADVIETTGGSIIKGKVIASEGGVIKVETDFAGVITIKQDQVKSIVTDDAVFVNLKDGSTQHGRVQAVGDELSVSSTAGTIVTPTAGITHLWREGDKSPADRAADALRRSWVYDVAFDLNGREGNKSRFFFGLTGRATLKGPDDRLVFYGNYSQADENGDKSQDEGKAGVDYTNNFSPKLSWYARTEIGYDKVKDLDLRSSSAAGMGYNLVKREKWNMEGRMGVSYRYESYAPPNPSFDAAGLDVGLLNKYQFSFGEMSNVITYTPAFSDFGNFVITHVSTIEMPFSGKRDIRLRFGLKNDYTSEPPPGLKSHDWSYFSSLVFVWK